MARKAIVDRDIILSLLKAGETTQRIADRFNVSRQAIDLHRKDFIKRGLLPNQRAFREKKERISPESNLISPRESLPAEPAVISLDEQIDLMINAFSALKRLPEVETELEKCRRSYEDALREIKRLKEREERRCDQERRWLSAQHRS